MIEAVLTRVIKSPVEHRRHTGVVRHEDDPAEVETLDYSIQILFLARESVGIVGRFARPSPAEEIEGHDLMPPEQWHDAVVQVVVVREAVAQHDRGAATGMNESGNSVTCAWDPYQLRRRRCCMSCCGNGEQAAAIAVRVIRAITAFTQSRERPRA